MTSLQSEVEPLALSIDELAAQSGTPSRTIREYQTFGVMPPPERHGRTGVYRQTHLRRLDLIARLQERGYSLAGIRDLLGAWRDGADLNEVLGLSADDLVHVDEPGAQVSIAGLSQILPSLVPQHLSDLLEVGLIDHCSPDAYCVPSPSLLHLTADMVSAGFTTKQVLSLLRVINQATTSIANASAAMLATPPKGGSEESFGRLVSRGRGLLAHATGRLTIYNLGKQLGPDAPGRRGGRRG